MPWRSSTSASPRIRATRCGLHGSARQWCSSRRRRAPRSRRTPQPSTAAHCSRLSSAPSSPMPTARSPNSNEDVWRQRSTGSMSWAQPKPCASRPTSRGRSGRLRRWRTSAATSRTCPRKPATISAASRSRWPAATAGSIPPRSRHSASSTARSTSTKARSSRTCTPSRPVRPPSRSPCAGPAGLRQDTPSRQARTLPRGRSRRRRRVWRPTARGSRRSWRTPRRSRPCSARSSPRRSRA